MIGRIVFWDKIKKIPGTLGDWEMHNYEVILGPAAVQVIMDLADPAPLAESLSSELREGPNADKEVRYQGSALGADHDGAVPSDAIYTATPLSFLAYTAVHRPMTDAELARLQAHERRRVARCGFVVHDILAAESAIARRPHPLNLAIALALSAYDVV